MEETGVKVNVALACVGRVVDIVDGSSSEIRGTVGTVRLKADLVLVNGEELRLQLGIDVLDTGAMLIACRFL